MIRDFGLILVTMKTTKMWIARMETGRFEFVALGETEKQAMAALAKGWAQHKKQYETGTDPAVLSCTGAILSWDQAKGYFGTVATEIENGGCIRDWDAKRHAEPSPSPPDKIVPTAVLRDRIIGEFDLNKGNGMSPEMALQQVIISVPLPRPAILSCLEDHFGASFWQTFPGGKHRCR